MGKKKARTLKVRRSFEPDRLALTYLKEAYEHLVSEATHTVVDSESESENQLPKSAASEEMAK